MFALSDMSRGTSNKKTISVVGYILHTTGVKFSTNGLEYPESYTVKYSTVVRKLSYLLGVKIICARCNYTNVSYCSLSNPMSIFVYKGPNQNKRHIQDKNSLLNDMYKCHFYFNKSETSSWDSVHLPPYQFTAKFYKPHGGLHVFNFWPQEGGGGLNRERGLFQIINFRENSHLIFQALLLHHSTKTEQEMGYVIESTFQYKVNETPENIAETSFTSV